MKRNGLLFAAVLAVGMGMSMPAWAEAPTQPDQGLGGLLGSLLEDGGVVDRLLNEDGDVSEILNSDEVKEKIGGLFEEGGPLAGIIPEDANINEMVEVVSSQLSDAGSALNQELSSLIEMATDESGNVDWEKVKGSVEELVGLFAGGEMLDLEGIEEPSSEDLDAFFAEFMIPYQKMDEAAFAYVGERNAQLMDAGDAQVFSKKVVHMGDPSQDEVQVLGEFTQVNYSIDGDQMHMVSAAADTMLFTMAKDADGNFTVTSEEHSEDGDGYDASVAAMCEAVGVPAEDFNGYMKLGAYNDAQALAKYLNEHPEIATAEYQGEQMTAEQLQALYDDYANSLFAGIDETAEEETE